MLSLTGHEIEAGRTVPLYEFKHLTFQEYLTALAVVDRNLPPALAERSIVDILQPHLLRPRGARSSRSLPCSRAGTRAADPGAHQRDEGRGFRRAAKFGPRRRAAAEAAGALLGR